MAGPVAMTTIAQKHLIQTLALEVKGTGIKAHKLILGPVKTRDRLKHGHRQDDWYYPEEIGQYICKLVYETQNDELVHYLLSKSGENDEA